MNECGLRTEIPGGAFYVFPNIASIDSDSRKVADLLLDHASIATIPGSVFGSHGESHLRFSFAVEMEIIEKGLEALRRYLAG